MNRSSLFMTVILVGGSVAVDAAAGGAARLRPWISLRFPGVEWVGAERLEEWMTAEPGPTLVLLDARTSAEFDVSHIAGARRVDPDAELFDLGDLPPETRIVAYCSVGYRSAAVAKRLAASGFEHVYNLEGGIFGWANEGRAVYQGREIVEQVHPYNRAWERLLDAHLHP
jgi:rhodanese-related sulfurtransferase